MSKRTLQLVLISNDGESEQVIHVVKSYRVPKGDMKPFVKDVKSDVKEALAMKKYEDEQPGPGMESGCW